MSQSLEERIKSLERELALKQAYLTVQFSFPKGNKLPEDVREQVSNELKNACTKLAEDKETNVVELNANHVSYLTQDEIKLLKDLATAARSRLNNAASQPASKPAPAQSQSPPAQTEFNSSKEGIKKATLLTLENVDPKVRSRMSSMETVFVSTIKEGYARITTQSGMSVNVPIDDLDFNL